MNYCSKSFHLNQTMMKKSILLSLVTCVAFSFAAAVAQETDSEAASAVPAVQEERLAIETKDKETPAMKGLKLERALRRAVPTGYGPIVNAVQREEIYRIQADYFEVIALLELRLELLRQERDAKIEGVLTPAQLEQIQRPARRTFLPRVNRTEP